MKNNWQDRVYNHEETPPKGVWEAIAKELDKKEAAKKDEPIVIKKVTASKIIYWKWAAAASIIFCLIATALYFNSNKVSTQQNLADITVPKNKQPDHTKTVLTSGNTEQVNTGNSTTLKTSPLKIKKIISPFQAKEKEINFQPTSMYAKTEETKPVISNPAGNFKEKLKDINGEEINDIALMNAPNTYVAFIGPNGQEVKISSKFSNIIGYLKEPETEEYLDKVISESSFWRSKFKEWRDKMTNNSVAPTPSNFMDIIELGKLLSENK